MNYKINWTNPYKTGGKFWLKGNLHTHTTLSDGKSSPGEVAGFYTEKGYGFLAITDHGKVFDGKNLRMGPLMISGVEADFDHGNHTCITALNVKDIKYSRETPQQSLINANKDKCLVVLNHPDWQFVEHYTIDKLMSFENYRGIEIYNSVIERLEGSPLSTAKWDRLLSAGRKVLGLANQDTHRPSDFLDCCNVVRIKQKTAAEVFKAMMTGNFYCYFGVKIKEIGRTKNTIHVKTENAEVIRFIGYFGRVLKKVTGKSASMSFDEPIDNPEALKYIRVECLGKGEEISWSQPFFRE
ncbi:MAG: hypothetical protein WCI43_09185 [Candidatus Firestonebacteria bacterium]